MTLDQYKKLVYKDKKFVIDIMLQEAIKNKCIMGSNEFWTLYTRLEEPDFSFFASSADGSEINLYVGKNAKLIFSNVDEDKDDEDDPYFTFEPADNAGYLSKIDLSYLTILSEKATLALFNFNDTLLNKVESAWLDTSEFIYESKMPLIAIRVADIYYVFGDANKRYAVSIESKCDSQKIVAQQLQLCISKKLLPGLSLDQENGKGVFLYNNIPFTPFKSHSASDQFIAYMGIVDANDPQKDFWKTAYPLPENIRILDFLNQGNYRDIPLIAASIADRKESAGTTGFNYLTLSMRLDQFIIANLQWQMGLADDSPECLRSADRSRASIEEIRGAINQLTGEKKPSCFSSLFCPPDESVVSDAVKMSHS